MEIGDLKLDQDEQGAREAYEQGMRIGRALSAADPNNPDLQTDLVIGLSKLASLQDNKGEKAAANANVQEAKSILERLTESRLLNSDRRHWPQRLETALRTLEGLRPLPASK